MINCSTHHLERSKQVSSITLCDVEIGKILHQARKITTGSLHLHGHADRITVVLQQKQHRQFEIAGSIKRFPEFSFATSAIAERNVHHLILVKVADAMFELFNELEPVTSFGTANCL